MPTLIFVMLTPKEIISPITVYSCKISYSNSDCLILNIFKPQEGMIRLKNKNSNHFQICVSLQNIFNFTDILTNNNCF